MNTIDMQKHSLSHQAVAVIKRLKPDFTPKVALVLGSGLGSLAEQIQEAVVIPYQELPGFSACSVAGHGSYLYLGYLNGVAVACLQGRVHLYEGIAPEVTHNLIRPLRLLGCEILLGTNSSGSLRKEVTPGNLVMITDHINFQGTNPLVGANDDAFGPRFLGMEDTYDLTLREKLKSAAEALAIPLYEGVYFATLGPIFETPAEIRAFKMLGADVIGMSTVPEVIVARHCGMKVAVIAAITNLGAGMQAEKLSHEGTLRGAKLAAKNMQKLVMGFLGEIKNG